MIKLIILNLFGIIVISRHCYAQADQLMLAKHLAFHQPDAHHLLNFHQPDHQTTNVFQSNSQPHLSSRPPTLINNNQQPSNAQRPSRLISSASSPKSSIVHPRTQHEQQTRQSASFNSNQNNFKPLNRPPQLRSKSVSNQKRTSKQQSVQQRNHAHHHAQSKINWGRCPMLQPSMEEKMKKAQVISKCLEVTPVPENITRETIELHRELVAACALREEGWFTTNALLSDESSSKINVNNTVNRMLLNTNLTTSSIDLMGNETITESDTKNNKNNKMNDERLKSKNNNETTTIETLLKSNHQPNSNGTTKMEQTTVDKTNSTQSTFNSTNSKTNKLDNQIEFFHENKHSALESDDYVEEDLSGYSAIFTGQLVYDYSKAMHEIRAKKFDPEVEEKVIQYHESCRDEAQEKYNSPIQIIGQIQLYQACMDWYISSVCGIEVIY